MPGEPLYHSLHNHQIMQRQSDDGGIIHLGLFVLFIMLIIFSVIIIGFFQFTTIQNEQSVYDYDLSLSTSQPIENVVLLIPVPSYYHPDSGDHQTIIHLSNASFNNFDRGGLISTKIEVVNGIPMLNISADRIDPIYKNFIMPIGIMPGQNESELPPPPTHVYSDRYSQETPILVPMKLHMHDRDAGHTIDTRMPFGTEPLFMPYRILENFSSSDGEWYEGYHLSGSASASLVEVPFFLSYTCDDDNALIISMTFRGSNNWWVGGWRGNSYCESVSHAFTGQGDGVCWVKGVLVMGEGVY